MKLDEMLAREAIRYTISRYNSAIDRSAYPELAEVFTPDGSMAFGGQTRFEGRDKIIAALSAGAQKRGALTVPRSALRRDDERYVYVVVHRHAHRRDVTVGLIGLSEVEILTGLREGERVVAEGPPSLSEDARVVEAKPQGP